MSGEHGNALRNTWPRECCANLVAENKKLLKALQKEKQRKHYVMTAYKKLLSAYQSVVDLKEVMDSSDSEDEDEKENIENPENNASFNRSSPMENQMIEQEEERMGFTENRETNRTSGRKISCLRRPASFHSSPSQTTAHSKQKQMSEWYFLAMEDEYEISKKLGENSKIDNLLKKSGERSKMIASTSQRRATIAANRRAVVVDIIQGKRQLDDEALKILHTDSSRISAFPRRFIKEMEEKAKSKYKQSQVRLEQERGYFRERQLEIMTNRILAHCALFSKLLSPIYMVRTVWVIRHAEREDNINPRWQQNKNPRGLKSDNSPLSLRGQKQADELCVRFAKQQLDHVFASPFDRTVETATRLIGNRQIPIKVEPGLAEALYLCEKPPGFQDEATLKNLYPLVDLSYKPVFPSPLPKEGYGDDSCVPRLRKTLETIFDKYKDESIALVAHGSPIGAIHEVLAGEWNYVGQATVSKFVENSSKPNKFKLEYTSDASHLADKSNLRAY